MGESKLVQDVQEILTIQDQINILEKQMLEIKNQYGLYKNCDIQNPYNVKELIGNMTKDSKEVEETFLTILRTNVIVAKNFLTDYCAKKELIYKDACFECMINYPDELVNLVERHIIFTPEQIEQIWDKHGEYIYKKVYRGFNGLNRFCEYFKNHINDEHRDTLIKRIIGRKLKWEAQRLIKGDNIGLNTNHITQLEGFLVAMKLMR